MGNRKGDEALTHAGENTIDPTENLAYGNDQLKAGSARNQALDAAVTQSAGDPNLFCATAGRLRARGSEWEGQAAVLASASAHLLRHTASSHMTDQRVDLRFVRDNFGHASIATTSAYLHSEEDARHEAT